MDGFDEETLRAIERRFPLLRGLLDDLLADRPSRREEFSRAIYSLRGSVVHAGALSDRRIDTALYHAFQLGSWISLYWDGKAGKSALLRTSKSAVTRWAKSEEKLIRAFQLYRQFEQEAAPPGLKRTRAYHKISQQMQSEGFEHVSPERIRKLLSRRLPPLRNGAHGRRQPHPRDCLGKLVVRCYM